MLSQARLAVLLNPKFLVPVGARCVHLPFCLLQTSFACAASAAPRSSWQQLGSPRAARRLAAAAQPAPAAMATTPP